MAFTVVYDANVLYPNTLRDLLLRIAQSGTVQAKWTNAILDEMTAALRRNRPDIPAEKTERLRELMNKAVRDCLVSGYEPLIEGLKLPDPDDRHVLAAAIQAGAQVIVTRNLKDFPAAGLEPWNIEAKSSRRLRPRPNTYQPASRGRVHPADRRLSHQPARSRRGHPDPARTRRPSGIHRCSPRGLAHR